MGAFDSGLGNPPINSTGFLPVAAPSTSTLLAELDSTQLGTKDFRAGQSRLYRVNWILGADTNATWQCESATDTSLGSGVEIFFPKTPSGQSAQYVTSHSLSRDMRLRARLFSTAVNAAAYISAEPVT
jgi:hypothetical protein